MPYDLVSLGDERLGRHEGDITTDTEVGTDAVAMVIERWGR